MTAPTRTRPRATRADWVRRGVMAAMVALAAGLGVYVVSNAVTGTDQASDSKPAGVIASIPRSGSEVLRQATVGVELAKGYDAALEINGVRIDNDADPSNPDGLQRSVRADGMTIEYTPGPGRRVPSLLSGRNSVAVHLWKQTEGKVNSSPWYFSFEAV